MLNSLSLLVRGVKEVGLRPTWEAVGYQIRLLWYRLRFGRRTRTLPSSPAAYRRPGPVTGWRLDGQPLTVACANGDFTLTVLAPDVVRVRFRPASQAHRPLRPSYAVVCPDDAWPACALEATESGEDVELRTSRLSCRIETASGRLAFLDPEGRIINADADGVGWHPDGQDRRPLSIHPPSCPSEIRHLSSSARTPISPALLTCEKARALSTRVGKPHFH
jgi:hypothetical protein